MPGGYDFSQMRSMSSPSSPRLFLQERLQVRPDVLEDGLLAGGVRVQAIFLLQRGVKSHLSEQKRNQWHMVLRGELREHARELIGVARTVVGRDADPEQQHARAGGLHHLEHL